MNEKKRKKYSKKQYKCRLCKKKIFSTIKHRNRHKRYFCEYKNQKNDPDYIYISDNSEDEKLNDFFEKRVDLNKNNGFIISEESSDDFDFNITDEKYNIDFKGLIENKDIEQIEKEQHLNDKYININQIFDKTIKTIEQYEDELLLIKKNNISKRCYKMVRELSIKKSGNEFISYRNIQYIVNEITSDIIEIHEEYLLIDIHHIINIY